MRQSWIFLIALLITGCLEPEIGEVPSANLSAGSEKQRSRLGTSCWSWRQFLIGTHSCQLAMGIITPSEPLAVNPLQAIQVDLPEGEGQADVEVCWIHASEGEWEEIDGSYKIWTQELEDCEVLSGVETFQLKAPSRLGYHVLSVFAWWGRGNDAGHGFFFHVSDD